MNKDTTIQANWKAFLRVDTNKDRLFRLLTNAIYMSFKFYRKKKSSQPMVRMLSHLLYLITQYYTHNKADTRMLFHVSHLFHLGFSNMMIYATYTDVTVVVLAIAVSSALVAKYG